MIKICLEENLKGKTLNNLLKIAHKAVLEAFIVRPLRSRDLNLYVKT